MSNKSGVSSQIISLPTGGGAQSGMGEKFSPDLFTGTGNFTVPIALPTGRNGFQPDLQLVYSTGNGNGPFGLGWNLSIPGVSRKTSKGIPVYDDSKDTFVLSGAEDLVPVGEKDNRTQYRPRTEGLYAVIERVLDADNDYWEVKTKSGLVSVYGTPTSRGSDQGVIYDPDNQDNVSSWKLTETRDTFGNRIVYAYESDLGETDNRRWNQLYLSNIRYVDYEDSDGKEDFLIKVSFDYEERPDSFSAYRTGFEIRTTKRCRSITVETATLKSKSVELSYSQSPLNQISHLEKVQVIGHKELEKQKLPPITFKYTEFDADKRSFKPLKGSELPVGSLANPDMEMVDLFGNGLPDFIQMYGVIRYWRNRGGGRFDFPRPMKNAPAGLVIEDPDVQMLDVNGEGKADLMVNKVGLSGYFPLNTKGEWDHRSFRKYAKSPSFSLLDPNVRLVDLDGDGVTDALRTSNRFECFFQDSEKGWDRTRSIARKRFPDFPDVSFADERVKLGDMTGDGLQDIVLVHDGHIDYWPSMGHGKWGKCIHMKNSPCFPNKYELKRIFIGDVDGDGFADIVYVDYGKTILWINQGGNSWSDPIVIVGTPPVHDPDGIRLIDLYGTGVKGVLWAANKGALGPSNLCFLDFTGNVKPYILCEMDNNTGATKRVSYKSSTEYCNEDFDSRVNEWKTNLPFPSQVVSRVETIDALSKGKLTTEYRYRHGYWDGVEREFRGFGRVDQYDTETFSDYHSSGLHDDAEAFVDVEDKFFSPPTLTKHWFHLGPVDDNSRDWKELDYQDEFWTDDPQQLERPAEMTTFLRGLKRRDRRDALRSMRGRTIRTELYALDGSERENRPYTVTETLHGVREDIFPELVADDVRHRIFFPYEMAQRTTQWERGDDPMTTLGFTEDYDECGQPRRKTQVACPRGWRKMEDVASESFLATTTVVEYANPITDSNHIRNRAAKVTEYEIVNDGTVPVLELKAKQPGGEDLSLIGQQLHFYDGQAFEGLEFGKVGDHGALVRTEKLILTEEILKDAYRSGDTVLSNPEIPPYLDPSGAPSWPDEYPQAFKDQIPELAGYTFHDGEEDSHFARGFFSTTDRRSYDFQEGSSGRGLVRTIRDPLGNETSVEYRDNDNYLLLPSRVTDAQGLETRAKYDYRVLQVSQITGPNGNRSAYSYTPAGLLNDVAVMGKPGENVGDTLDEPSLKYEYDFLAFEKDSQPLSVRTIKREHHVNDTDIPQSKRDDTIELVEYSDGFGRLLQSRAQAEDLTFGDLNFGDAGLDSDQSIPVRDAVGQQRGPESPQRVTVTGWKVYDNKGRVVEEYEPFFSEGWSHASPTDVQRGQKVTNFYDPRGQQIRTVFADGSEQIVVPGVPTNLNNPFSYEPTPWEAYTYDPNDNAGRTHEAESTEYRHHWNTPASATVDALGRIIQSVERNGLDEETEWLTKKSTYDIRGNVLEVVDELGRLAFQHIYDLAGTALRTQNLDAGVKRVIRDAAGNPIENRDSKGSLILDGYDSLNRPRQKWARDGQDESVTLREFLVYGDSPDSGLTAELALHDNLLGNLYRHYDEAGLLEVAGYDFKGNVLEKSRKTIRDDVILGVFSPPPDNWKVTAFRVDWEHPSGSGFDTHVASLVDSDAYQTNLKYDALSRVKRLKYPEDIDGTRKELVPEYNRAGALQSVTMDGSQYVGQIAYNAKGQRVLVAYGNGTMTRYSYDPQTFRLRRMRTDRFSQPEPLTYRPKGQALQDMVYEYDLHGNILSIMDTSPGSGIAPTPDHLKRDFTYDPIYRLLSATGRESDQPNSSAPWDDTPQNTDVTKTRTYTERYHYDAAGNIISLQHQNANGGFTRNFDFIEGSNRFKALNVGSNSYQYLHDKNGNLIQENSSRFFEWDHSDRLRSFRIQAGDSEPSVYSNYLYDSAGQRVKKLTRKSGANTCTTVYIDSVFEEHREHSNGVERKNTLLHIMDNDHRIAARRVGDAFPGDNGPAVQYHFGDHLGSSNLVVDDSGSWTNREEFTPYGETSFGSYAKKRYRYNGKEKDEHSGLYYYGARYYAPWLGRWLSADPAGPVDGLNLYIYVSGNPVRLRDPEGRQENDPTTPAYVDPVEQIYQEEVSGAVSPWLTENKQSQEKSNLETSNFSKPGIEKSSRQTCVPSREDKLVGTNDGMSESKPLPKKFNYGNGWSQKGLREALAIVGEENLISNLHRAGWDIGIMNAEVKSYLNPVDQSIYSYETAKIGNTDFEDRIILLRADLSNEEAAAVLFHESIHALKQSRPARSIEENVAFETESRIETVMFRKKQGRENTITPGYINSKGIPDKNSIKQHVQKISGYTGKRKVPSHFVLLATEFENGTILTGW